MNSKIISFAIDAHNKVNHLYDGKPYSVHLSMVAMYAMKYSGKLRLCDTVIDIVLDSCWLHDTIEDCRLSYNDIKEVAGGVVADIVYAVTNDKGKTRADRQSDLYYYVIKNTPLATYVKMCDRLANVKYSKDNKSKMLDVYRKENDHFIGSLFDTSSRKKVYNEMICELNSMFE